MEKEFRILILEDLPSDAELAQKELKKFLKTFVVKVVDTEKGFIQALEKFKPDLIISDYHLPAFDGLSALRITREKSSLIPFIIFTGSINEETAVECIQAGADDYVIKESIIRLAPAVLGAMEKKKTERERLNAIQALRESEVKYRNLFTQIADPVFVFAKRDHCFLDCNQSALDRYGYTLEELRDMTPYQLHHSEEQAEVDQRIDDEFDTSLHRYTHLTKGGEDIQVEISTTPIEYEGQEAWISIARDITERLQAEEALRKSEENYRGLFENALVGVGISNASGKVIATNKTMSKMTGYSLEEFSGVNIRDTYVNPESRKRLLEIMNRDGLVENFDVQLLNSEGEKYWASLSVKLITYGGEDAFLTSALDITDRKMAEKLLAHSHELMTYVIEHNQSAIAVHDRNLNYIYVSKKYLDVFKVKDSDVIGKHHYDVFPDLPQKWRDVHQEALVGKVSSAEDDPFPREDGTVDWTRWECRPWYEADGSIGGIIIYTEVITERKEEEKEKELLLKQVQQANERLKFLTRELINSQEEERKRISRELHDELGQALTAITLDLKIIERALDPETDQVIAQRISETRVIADEIDQKISELALDLRPSLLDDLGLIPTINWYVERYAKRAEVEIKLEVNDQEKRLSSEIETALYRIIQEALTNVARHARAKKVKLRLDQQPETVTLTIEDDGRGFDLDELQNTGSSPQGLGLTGMKDRLSLLGGRLDIQSKPGEGTRIEIEIPF